MELKDQVCNLELSKKLKELRVKQNSLWWWVTSSQPSGQMVTDNMILYLARDKGAKYPMCSAFTVAELGEILPRVVQFKRQDILKRLSYSNTSKPEAKSWYGCGAYGKLYIDCIKDSLSGTHADKDRWNVNYLTCSTNKLLIHNEQANTEADTRAKMLIWLIENDLIVRRGD